MFKILECRERNTDHLVQESSEKIQIVLNQNLDSRKENLEKISSTVIKALNFK